MFLEHAVIVVYDGPEWNVTKKKHQHKIEKWIWCAICLLYFWHTVVWNDNCLVFDSVLVRVDCDSSDTVDAPILGLSILVSRCVRTQQIQMNLFSCLHETIYERLHLSLHFYRRCCVFSLFLFTVIRCEHPPMMTICSIDVVKLHFYRLNH